MKKNEALKNLICAALLALSFVMIAKGSKNGEVIEVLRKSVSICLECIGIG